MSEPIDETADTPARRAFRAPWKWERLLAESRVVASEERWERRLNGLIARMRTAAPRAARAPSPSRRGSTQLERKIDDLRSSRRSRCRSCARWPRGRRRRRGPSGWTTFDALAPRVLRRPDRVLRVFADLRPMGAIGPVTLDEAARVLADRLADASKPSRRRAATAASSSPAPRSCAAAPSTSCSSRRWPSGCFRRSRARIRCCSTRRGSGSTPSLPRQAERAELGEAAAAAGRRRGRVAAVRVVSRPWRSAKDGRACRRCTRSKSGAR